MMDRIYTAIAINPVHSSISKLSTLKDLQGQAIIQSYVLDSILHYAETHRHQVIDFSLQRPSHIMIQGDFDKDVTRKLLRRSWEKILDVCRHWIEANTEDFSYSWKKEWDHRVNHGWEIFWAQGQTITDTWNKLKQEKWERDWIGINWQGESTQPSFADAIAWPRMGQHRNPLKQNYHKDLVHIDDFYDQLCVHPDLDEDLAEYRQYLSIPELVTRLITYPIIRSQLGIPSKSELFNFSKVNHGIELSSSDHVTWFLGGGDNMSAYLKSYCEENEGAYRQVREKIQKWNNSYLKAALTTVRGSLVLADSERFIGLLPQSYSKADNNLTLTWLIQLRNDLWKEHGQGMGLNMGLVLVKTQISQDVIFQNCQKAKKSAERNGGDRLAVRILYKNHRDLEWICPWWFLERLLSCKTDSSSQSNLSKWKQFYRDVMELDGRHAFEGEQCNIALEIFKIYFGSRNRDLLEKSKWRRVNSEEVGILGYQGETSISENYILNQWIKSLSKVGLSLCSNI